MNDGVLSAIGKTPLVRLLRVIPDARFKLYAKLEGLNPGGSTKDRPAFSILRHAIDSGDIQPGTVVIESSSGNMGIGLAQACMYYGLRFICVVDPKATVQNVRLLKAYGAEVDVVQEPDKRTGEYLQARLNRVKDLLDSTENTFWPNQYSHRYNPIAHYQTMHEVVTELGGEVDYLFCATSTCGTIRGCAEYAREHKLPTKIFAVDAVGSVIFGGENRKRLIPGHGAAVRPALYQPDVAERCIHVTDLQCVVGCRRLVRDEAILAGGSSGAVLMAIEQIKDEIEPGATCAAIFADKGERYLDTIYCDSWVEEHFGNVAHLWQAEKEMPVMVATG
ncbi:MAG TPA: 2,3-diaminopropionate biosynthesis protein SbnA [Pyrinomonadaceae bacterium]|nr:2,3-diaminopropionate biosynthesis protein SbnA [Pyrinomonadaceae bacterium]